MRNQFLPIRTEQDLRDALYRSETEPIVLLKHSVSCPVSAWAFQRMQVMEAGQDPPVYLLVIQHARPLSNEVARVLDVRHESPQVIVVYQSRALFHASHSRVNPETVLGSVARIKEEAGL